MRQYGNIDIPKYHIPCTLKIVSTVSTERPGASSSRDRQKDQESKDANWHAIYPELLQALGTRKVGGGRVCLSCHRPAIWWCTSCEKEHSYCSEHIVNDPYSQCHLINSSGSYHQSDETKILLLSISGWKYAGDTDIPTLLKHGFFPGSPKVSSMFLISFYSIV
jgi:predicted amidophosphoribosyltransferase